MGEGPGVRSEYYSSSGVSFKAFILGCIFVFTVRNINTTLLILLFHLQCHNELGNITEATNWTELALKMPTNSKDVRIILTVSNSYVNNK